MNIQKTRSEPGIIALFKDKGRNSKYARIYKGPKHELAQQLYSRILIYRVFKRVKNYDMLNAMNFSHKKALFDSLKASANSQIDDTWINTRLLGWLDDEQSTENKTLHAENSKTNKTTNNQTNTLLGNNIAHPTYAELQHIVDEIKENVNNEDGSIQLSEAVKETPKQLDNGAYMLKVNLCAEREVLLKEFDAFLSHNQSLMKKRAPKSELTREKLKISCYLQIFDIMIFHAFYENLRPSKDPEDGTLPLNSCENFEAFFGNNLVSIETIIKQTIDQAFDQDLVESYRKTVAKNIGEWVHDSALNKSDVFIKHMSELKIK